MLAGDRSALAAIDWGRLAERLCFLFPPAVGVGIVGVLREQDPGVPGLGLALVLIGSFGYGLLSLALAAVLFLDARRIRRSEETRWAPRPLLTAVGAVLAAPLLLAPFVGVVYLARRHRRFGTPPGWSGWWVVVAVSLATTLFGLVAAVVAVVFAIPGLLGAAVGLAGTIAFGTFPVAIHQDAAYVSAESGAWRPNPGLYLGFAFLSLFVAPVQPIVAGYYLVRRRRAVGLEFSLPAPAVVRSD